MAASLVLVAPAQAAAPSPPTDLTPVRARSRRAAPRRSPGTACPGATAVRRPGHRRTPRSPTRSQHHHGQQPVRARPPTSPTAASPGRCARDNNARQQRLDQRRRHTSPTRPPRRSVSPVGGDTLTQPDNPPLSSRGRRSPVRSATRSRSTTRVLRRPPRPPTLTTRSRTSSIPPAGPRRPGTGGSAPTAATASTPAWSVTATYTVGQLTDAARQGPTTTSTPPCRTSSSTGSRCRAPRTTSSRSATTPTSTTIVDDQTVIAAPASSRRLTYNNDQYYWRVRPVDAGGNRLRLDDRRHLALPAQLAGPADAGVPAPTPRPSATRSTTSGPRCRTLTGTSFS